MRIVLAAESRNPSLHILIESSTASLVGLTFVPNFEAMSHLTSVLGSENHVKNLVYKAVLLRNALNTAKNISQGYYTS